MTGARSRLSGVLLGLALVLPVVASAGVWQWQRTELAAAEASQADDEAVLDAATTQTLAWASVDYRKVDEYVASVEAGATGAFLKQFQESEDALRQLLESNKSVQVPSIPEGGVGLFELDPEADVATVLVAMDATVTNTSTKTPQPRQYRLKVTMVEEGDEWLTSGLEFIDAQS